jgi:hypothetical protein
MLSIDVSRFHRQVRVRIAEILHLLSGASFHINPEKPWRWTLNHTALYEAEVPHGSYWSMPYESLLVRKSIDSSTHSQ